MREPTADVAAGAIDAMNDRAEVAALLSRVSCGGKHDLVWTSPLGGRTFRLVVDGEVQYLKVTHRAVPEPHDAAFEAEQVRWIGARLPVPEVVESGRSSRIAWMRTRALVGIPASDPRWLEDARRTARAMGKATRWFHDAMADAVETCPYSWRVRDRLRRGEFSDAAHRKGAEAPDETDLVIAHGDMCAPNILLTEDRELSGFLDFGTMGVADRAVDLGSQLWSLERNGMAGHLDDLLAAYDYTGEVAKIRWYRDFYAIV